MAVLLIPTMMLTAGLFSALPVHADPVWNVQTINDSVADAEPCSIAINSNNVTHILYTAFEEYYDSNGREFKFNVTYWSGQTGNTQVIDEGVALSLAFDAKGNPHILYESLIGSHPLMYASWTGSNWSIQPLGPDIFGILGNGQLALDSFGNPHIAFNNDTTLGYASWTGTNWTIQTVDTYPPGGFVGISLALNSNNIPYILYETNNVKLAMWKNSGWNIQTVVTVGSTHSNFFSLGNMILDSNGYPHFVYEFGTYLNGSNLMYANWDGKAWETQTVASGIDVYYDGATNIICTGSLALDSHGYPEISYFGSSELMYASWTGVNWSFQNVSQVSTDEDVIYYITHLALDSGDNPHIICLGNGYPIGTIWYASSTQPSPTVTPTSSPSIPEFKAWIILPLFIAATTLTLMFARKKITKRSRTYLSFSFSAQFSVL